MNLENNSIQLDVTSDPVVEKRVRKTVDMWAEGIFHHPYKNLGTAIQIASIHFRPTYHLTLQTQYEMREKSSSERAYDGSPISELKYSSLSEINEWSIGPDEIGEFTESDDWYDVDGSEQVKQCSSCDGAGRTRCSSCNGAGITTCSSCRGIGNDLCSRCNGTGNEQKSCSSCSGTGSKWDTTNQKNEQCYSCSGKGRWVEKCDRCDGAGRIICSSCQGQGRVTCSGCHGEGYNSCFTCSGQGRVVELFMVRRKLFHHTLSATFFNDQITKDFPTFTLNTKKYCGIQVLDLDDPEVSVPATDGWEPLAALFVEKHEEAQAQVNRKTRIQHQQLLVYRTDVFQVNYSFKGRDYVLLVYDDGEKGDVFAPIGPISELRQVYVEGSQKHASKKEYFDAWHKIKTALEIGKDEPWGQRDEAINLADKIKNKITGHYVLGQVVGAALAALIFIPLLLWIIPVLGFILPPVTKLYTQATWMEQIYPYTVYIFFLCGLFWVYLASGAFLNRFFMFSVSSNSGRVWIGAGSFLVIAAYVWLLMLMFHITGVPMLLTYLVKIFTDAARVPIVA